MDEEGHGGIVPGLACDSALVEEIIRELPGPKDVSFVARAGFGSFASGPQYGRSGRFGSGKQHSARTSVRPLM